MADDIHKGSIFEWRSGEHPLAVCCAVNRVARDASWADFTMTAGGSSWGKRMTLPLPETFRRIS